MLEQLDKTGGINCLKLWGFKPILYMAETLEHEIDNDHDRDKMSILAREIVEKAEKAIKEIERVEADT